jgi:hypothetical protein
MSYQVLLLLLFRPFMKSDWPEATANPRAICISAANEICHLFDIYRQHYSLRRIPLNAEHIRLSAALIHMVNMPLSTSSEHLAQSIRDLEEMSDSHHFSHRSLAVIKGLAKKWGLHIPNDVQNKLHRKNSNVEEMWMPTTIAAGNPYVWYGSGGPSGEVVSPDSGSGSGSIDAYVAGEWNLGDVGLNALSESGLPLITEQAQNNMPTRGNSDLLELANFDWNLINQDGFGLVSLEDFNLGFTSPNISRTRG